jgi:hypothetical protein
VRDEPPRAVWEDHALQEEAQRKHCLKADRKSPLCWPGMERHAVVEPVRNTSSVDTGSYFRRNICTSRPIHRSTAGWWEKTEGRTMTRPIIVTVEFKHTSAPRIFPETVSL